MEVSDDSNIVLQHAEFRYCRTNGGEWSAGQHTHGGCLRVETFSSVEIFDSIFDSCSSDDGNGGAIAVLSWATVSMSRTTVRHMRASYK